jgi:hypothetical protein
LDHAARSGLVTTRIMDTPNSRWVGLNRMFKDCSMPKTVGLVLGAVVGLAAAELRIRTKAVPRIREA